jgi:hypothetical protein
VLRSSYGVRQAPPESPCAASKRPWNRPGLPYTILRPVAFVQNFSEGLRWRESFADDIRERYEIVGRAATEL